MNGRCNLNIYIATYHQIHVEASVFSRRISVLALILGGRWRVLITGGYFTAQPGPPRANNRRRPSTTISFINDRQLHQRPPASSTTKQRPAMTSNDHQLHQRPSASSTTISFINDHQLHQRPPASSTTTSFINDQQRLLRTHQTQRLSSTHHDHESRCPCGDSGNADVPAETLDLADVPAETLDLAVVPAETLDLAVVPAETLDFAVVPAETLDFAVVPAETLDLADVPAETLGNADVPAKDAPRPCGPGV
ncbi:hypothetical protein N7450_011532 [Penicillium hetheringtonii]|uniref:Uncharacterized protein n=1 Tax=Penicillium hetheringtonii TaxID=911720 RepID=A0AAD6GL27_9EURO|nr:hypothetical protein N7450_011532 [Penicillium hetheringtonii]